ncbi:MAG: class I tRNA ligase family protein, partial [Geodermatophilaceae bacterium]|nr:class I tRNA ligase family protein [Geodermatophilaceae bacterium]
DTLYTVLEVTSRLAAPLLPMITEQVWRGLTGQASVHLTDWPTAQDLPDNDGLVADMDAVRSVCSVALSIRKANRVRVRQPLPSLTVQGADHEHLRDYIDLIKDEVNVKVVHLEALTAQTFVLRPNARVLGPRLGSKVQHVIRAARAGEFTENPDGSVSCAGEVLTSGEFELTPAVGDDAGTRFEAGRMILLDLTLTSELLAEGLARDVIRGIQESRREAGLAISDRIRLTLGAASVSAATALRAHQDLIARETLACELSIEALPEAEQEPSGTSAANMGAEWSAGNVDLGADDGLVAIALRRAG